MIHHNERERLWQLMHRLSFLLYSLFFCSVLVLIKTVFSLFDRYTKPECGQSKQTFSFFFSHGHHLLIFALAFCSFALWQCVYLFVCQETRLAISLSLSLSVSVWGGQKKVNHKHEEKMHSKVKMTSQRAKNLVHVRQHCGKHFYKNCKKNFSIMIFLGIEIEFWNSHLAFIH